MEAVATEKKTKLNVRLVCNQDQRDIFRNSVISGTGMVDFVENDFEADMIVCVWPEIAWDSRAYNEKYFIYILPSGERRTFNFPANVFVVPENQFGRLLADARFFDLLCRQKEYRNASIL
jgi:hypothetical protein